MISNCKVSKRQFDTLFHTMISKYSKIKKILKIDGNIKKMNIFKESLNEKVIKNSPSSKVGTLGLNTISKFLTVRL